MLSDFFPLLIPLFLYVIEVEECADILVYIIETLKLPKYHIHTWIIDLNQSPISPRSLAIVPVFRVQNSIYTPAVFTRTMHYHDFIYTLIIMRLCR